jgi:antitoxin component YwqK of YwqJK toxin-antitoxin module
MKYRFIITLGCIVFALACQQKELVTEELPSGLLIQYEVNDEGEKHGEYVLLSSENDTLEHSYYENDELDGIRTLFSDSGAIEIVEKYEKGKLEGVYKGFYPSGALKYEGIYSQNEMKGLWTFYYESGNVKEKVNYLNNEENGPFLEYDDDGTLRAKGEYIDGDNEHGLLYLYDEDGAPARVMKCDRGVCITKWTPDSTEVHFNDFK